MARKRKSSTLTQVKCISDDLLLSSLPLAEPIQLGAKARKRARFSKVLASTNPDQNPSVLDAPNARRASPDSEGREDGDDRNPLRVPSLTKSGTSSLLSEPADTPLEKEVVVPKPKSRASKVQTKRDGDRIPVARKVVMDDMMEDPEPDEEEADEEELKEALSRPPPVNSDYLPLPWKGRLGYACLNTYLRFSNPPVFASRTCRIASILEHRHPLRNPEEPPHATKNRPDRDQPATIARGQAYVEALGLANARDVVKMLRWNDRYGIKFMRLSSEMFPFCSHKEYGYKLAPFASETLAEIGAVAAELGHRLSTHPGQFTQLGSPRPEVTENAIRDLEFHAEMLSLLRLPPQQDRDAIMVLHLGGVYGDKEAALNRFRENYSKLGQHIKDRLVLENDDVSWSVHDLLPVCEELDIPMVLDFHHNNIIFDSEHMREGTKDIMALFPRIIATWRRRGKTAKMHYSEPTPSAITGRQRRKHSPRVSTLPPCPDDMDLMIEAKDKEQAVFELMRNFKLPGHDTFSDMLPHIRNDDNKALGILQKKSPRKKATASTGVEDHDEAPQPIPGDEVAMGGPEGRVYWPPGMEHWLRPAKRVVKKLSPPELLQAKKAKAKAAAVATAKANDGPKDQDIEEKAAVQEVTGSTRKPDRKPTSPRKAAGKRTSSKPMDNVSTSTSEDVSDGGLKNSGSRALQGLGKRSSARAVGRKVKYVEQVEI